MTMERDEYEFVARFRTEAIEAARGAQMALDEIKKRAKEAKEGFEEMPPVVDEATNSIVEWINGVGQAATVGAAFTVLVGSLQQVYQNIQGSLQAMGDYDLALIGIAKTADLTDIEVRDLGKSLADLAIAKGIDVAEYTQVAAVAGQLGVKGAENIRNFTSTIVDLGNASNLAGEEGAQTLARMLTVSGEHISKANTLASVIVRLGNNVAASEREIAQSAQEIALSTAPFEIGTTRAAALGAAMAEIGLNPALTGTSIGRIFIEMAGAVGEGGKRLETFAKATNLTTQEFRELYETDPTALFMKLLETMNGMDQSSIIRTMTSLNVMNSESAKTLLPLISGYERVRDVMTMALNEELLPTAMANEAERAEQAFNRVGQRLVQAAAQQQRLLGEAFRPVATAAMEAATDAISAFDGLPDTLQKAALAAGALAPALTAAVGAIVAVRAGMALLRVEAIATSAVMTALRASVAGLAGPIGIAVLAIGAIATAIALSSREVEDFETITSRMALNSDKLATVNEKLKNDTVLLADAKRALNVAVDEGSQSEQRVATIAVASIEKRMEANKQLAEQLKILRQNDLDDAQAAYDREVEALGQRALAVMEAVATAQAVNNGTYSTTDWPAILSANLQRLKSEGVEPIIGDLMALRASMMENEAALTDADRAVIAQIDGLLAMAVQTDETGSKVEGLKTNVENLGKAADGATGGLAAATAAASSFGAAASVASGQVASLVDMIPRLKQAAAVQAGIANAQAVYNDGMAAANAAYQNTGDLVTYQAAVVQLSVLQQEAINTINGTAEATKDANNALKEYTTTAETNALEPRAQAIAREGQAYGELVKQIEKAGYSETERLAKLEAAEVAHQQNLATIKERFDKSDAKAAAKKTPQTDEEKAYGRLGKAMSDYRAETDALRNSIYEDDATRQMRMDTMKLEQMILRNGIVLTDEERQAIARATEDRQRAIEEGKQLLPSLYNALDQTIQSMGDASDLANDVIGGLSDGFDTAIDFMLDRGSSGYESLQDMAANAFKNMGAAVLKYALQLMILEPILARIKGASADGGGGGILGFLGNVAGGFLSGGTATKPAAKGRVFTQSGVQNNTMFAEAGPEALVPLTRTPDGSLGVRMMGGGGGGGEGIHIGTYAPSYHIEMNNGAPGADGMSEEQQRTMMASLDAHMKAAFLEFLTEQQRNGGALNPTVGTY